MPNSRILAREMHSAPRLRTTASVADRLRATDARATTATLRRHRVAPRTIGALVLAAAVTLVMAPVAEAISHVL